MDLSFSTMVLAPALLSWYHQVRRPLPWRNTREPYPIWIAEVVFQQTRIDQGMGHYQRIMDMFPDVHTLATAAPEVVLKAWEGLGYYARARNLHKGAKQISLERGGAFPETVEGWEAISGVGPYTARAIVSCAFGIPVGVVDGNVIRIWSRVNDIPAIPDRKACQEWADDMVAMGNPAEINNAMMELGALLCHPRKPDCRSCPWGTVCLAKKNGTISERPVKPVRKTRPKRYFKFYLIQEQGSVLVYKRPEIGIWAGLWDIPNEEIDADMYQSLLLQPGTLGTMKHAFTHFEMLGVVVDTLVPGHLHLERLHMIGHKDIAIFAFPKAVLHIFRQFLQIG